jgi:hypothetical protein
MVPIVEMSQNPMMLHHFNVLHDRTTMASASLKALKEAEIAAILTKPAKTPQAVLHGRRTFLPNLHQIEIDITYECNLKCINCNRSSTQAPIQEGIALEKVMEFVAESIELGKQWKKINLLGGEPTLHKDFLQITDMILNDYIIPYSPTTVLQVTSNGFGERVQHILKQLPQHPQLKIDTASFKTDRTIPYFSAFNDAPIDKTDLPPQEYHKGCWITAYCGIGLNQMGYYPCGVAGGIDRVFGFGLGIPSLKAVDESLAQLLEKFCRYCGHFTDYAANQGNFIPRAEKAFLNKPVVSKTWRQQYRHYNES